MAPLPRSLALTLAVAALAAAAPSPSPAPAPAPAPAEGVPADSGFVGGLHVLYNSLSQCERSEDMGSCLKLKAIRSLERALASDSVELVDGVALARAEGESGGRALDGAVPPFEERALPAAPAARQQVLDDLLADRARRLFSTRTLSFAVPRALRRLLDGDQDGEDGGEDALQAADGADAAHETGRRRGGKKHGGLLMMGLLWKGWMTMMAYKGVAVLAGKALMTATVALVLAGILALSKLAHHGHDKGHTTVEIVRHPHVTHSYSHSASHEHVDDGHGHGWGRALEEEEQRRRTQRERTAQAQRAQPSATGVSASASGAQPLDAQQLAYRAYHQRQMQQQQQVQQVQQQVQAQYQTQPQGEAMTVPL